MSGEISPCQHCGCVLTYVHAQARGPVEVHYDETGMGSETFYDKTRLDASHVVRCEDCGKIRRDLEVTGIGVRKKG